MVVTFNALPPGVEMEGGDEKRARKLMDKHIKKAGETTKDRILLIDLNLKDKSYTFKVEKGKKEEYCEMKSKGSFEKK
jgi:hypothetical protein